jgi:diadenosine tetraphosphatase ApaH/serine/threonine PP2A family protein phosphatase
VTPIAAFGGAYGNPYALRAVLEDARRRGAGRVLNLGDLGGFGAEVDALWPLLEEHGVASLAGNYDVAIGRGDPDCGCGYTDPRDNEFAQVMYDHTRRTTSREFAAWMRELPGELRLEADGLDVLAVHGSPLDVADFLWESLPDDELALRVRAGGSPDVLLCTHTGLPWQREVDGTLVVNVGAAGRPANDGTRDVWYALLETDGGVARAELVRVAYDWRAQAASMRAAGLPEAFVETVETGWWTTCLEVVPPLERSRGAFHVYRDALPAPATGSDAGWADPVEAPAGDRPVVPLFGTALFPPRLWVYTNFYCNLACGYCVVESSPRARARRVGGGGPGTGRPLGGRGQLRPALRRRTRPLLPRPGRGLRSAAPPRLLLRRLDDLVLALGLRRAGRLPPPADHGRLRLRPAPRAPRPDGLPPRPGDDERPPVAVDGDPTDRPVLGRHPLALRPRRPAGAARPALPRRPVAPRGRSAPDGLLARRHSSRSTRLAGATGSDRGRSREQGGPSWGRMDEGSEGRCGSCSRWRRCWSPRWR